jgi:hypothetical protein
MELPKPLTVTPNDVIVVDGFDTLGFSGIALEGVDATARATVAANVGEEFGFSTVVSGTHVLLSEAAPSTSVRDNVVVRFGSPACIDYQGRQNGG